jgi:hypothetical protein
MGSTKKDTHSKNSFDGLLSEFRDCRFVGSYFDIKRNPDNTDVLANWDRFIGGYKLQGTDRCLSKSELNVQTMEDLCLFVISLRNKRI